MFDRLDSRWTRLAIVPFVLIASMAGSSLAGNTHSEGGAVLEESGVPETDGTAQVRIYWTGDPTDQALAPVGNILPGYWLEDVGYALTREWQVGDEHVAFLELETGEGTTSHAGFYAVSTKNLTSLDPDEFSSMTVRAIPTPTATAGDGYLDVTWSSAIGSGIAGYNVFRSTDGIAFTQMNTAIVTDNTYRDATAMFGQNYNYALGLVYRGTPDVSGTTLSTNSNTATPNDTTPPAAPVLASEPAYTSGTSNTLAWTSESQSGTTSYLVECAIDAGFGSLDASSGWIPDTTFVFSGLDDGQNYYFRVRGRDAAMNESSFSLVVQSQQDATPPQSQVAAQPPYVSDTQVMIDWTGSDAVSGVTGIELYYSKDGGAYTLYPGGPFDVSPLAFDTQQTGGDGQYDFYSMAADGAGNTESAPSAPDATTSVDTQPPASPTLAAVPTYTAGTTRSHDWTSATATGAVAYQIQASLSETFDLLEDESGWIPDTTHTFTNLTDGARYYYRVRGRDTAGNESSFSGSFSSTQDATAPETAVQSLATAMTTHALSIPWGGSDATSGVDGVELYYTKDGGPETLLAGGPFTTSPIAFDASQTGGDGTYAFYTRGIDGVGNVETAPAGPDAQTNIDTAAPGQPTLASLPSFSPGITRTLDWSASDADEFMAEVATDQAFSAILAESGWITESTHTFNGLTDGQEYFYRVRGRDQAGNETPFSPVASSTQDATIPTSQLASLSAYSTQSMLSLGWSGNDTTSGVTGVDLYFRKDAGAPTLYPGSPFSTTPISFDAQQTGGDGHYLLYTRAHDGAGNTEPAPASADAETTIDTAAPGQPSITALPSFNPGTSLLLDWTGSGADTYRAQAATDAGFASIVGESGWIPGASFTFTGLADGQEYFYRVHARDLAGNESPFSLGASSTQDATPPATTVESLPALTNTSAISIAWNGADATSGLAGIDLYYSKDGGTYDAYPGGPFASSPIAFDANETGGDGSYSFYTRATDAAGNVESAPASPDAQTTFDTAAPGAPSIAGLRNFEPGTTLVVSWTDESASGAVEYWSEMSRLADFSNIEATSGWIPALSHQFTSLADGQRYYFRVKARDGAQNETGHSGIQNATMDATAPTSAVETLPAFTSSPQYDIAWSGADAASGIENVDLYYSRNSGPFTLYPGGPFSATPIAFDATTLGGDGDYRFYTRAHDGVGNQEAAPATEDAAFTVDTVQPSTPTLASLPEFSLGTSMLLSWSDAGSSGATAYRAEAARDSEFQILKAESGWITETTHTFADLADGQTYYYRVRSRDDAQNESTTSTLAMSTQDATAPTSLVTPLADYSITSTFDLSWTGDDATSGIQNVDLHYTRNGGALMLYPGGPFATSPISFDAATVGGDGTFTFFTRARDGVGHLEDAPASPDAQTTIDTSGPGIPVLAGLPSFLPGTSMTLGWSDLGAEGATEYLAQVSEQASFTSLADESGWIPTIEHTFTNLGDGRTYYYRVSARDVAGNEGDFSTPVSATQDATPPASQLEPLAAVTNTALVQLTWNGFDTTSGLGGVDLYYSHNSAPFVLHAGSPFTDLEIEFASQDLGGDGHYAFYTRAHDTAGNLESPPPAPDAATRIDTQPSNVPTLAGLTEFSPGSSLVVSWSNESTTGAAEYQVELSTSPTFETLESESGWFTSTSYVFNGLDDAGTYSFRVKSRDAALNESPYSTVQTTTMDDTAPASLVAALPSVTVAEAFDIAWSGNDATSGLAEVDLYYARDGGAYTSYPGGPFATSPISFDTSLTGGEGDYAFYTRAKDRVGNREPGPGGPDATTRVSADAVGTPVLAALPSFTSGTSRTLGWTSGGNSNEYRVQASREADFGILFATSPWISETIYTFADLTDGATYYYRVLGRNGIDNEGEFSSVGSSTQDATAPISEIASLPPVFATHEFEITWSSSDSTSGVTAVDLYVSRNGGDYVAHPGGPFTESPIHFDATTFGGDGEYAFYTLATDGAGNVEAFPTEPDVMAIVDTRPPLAPVMQAEPDATQGSANTVAWTAAADAHEYMAECATDRDFLNVIASSGWIPKTSYRFADLVTGNTYFYRVRARDAAQNEGPFSAVTQSEQSMGNVLAAGWNLISFHVDPPDHRIDIVLGSIEGSYRIVRAYEAGAFRSYLPTLPLEMSDLKTMDAEHGYWIYMTRRDTLAVEGAPIASSTPIDLETGWNLTGFLPTGSMTPEVALASIQDSYLLVRGYEAGAGYRGFYPTMPSLSDLNEMQNGQGYWFFMTQADRLVYGALPKTSSGETSEGVGDAAMLTRSEGSAVPTVMDVWSTSVTLDGEPAPAGAVLEAYDASGTRVGSITLQEAGQLGVMHLYGDVSVTEEDEGAIEGEELTFRVDDQDVTILGDGSLTWKSDGAREIELELATTEFLLPKAFSLAQNHPNPFNPTTTIHYTIPSRANGAKIATSHVQLRIHDVRGRIVRTLVNNRQAPGRYSVVWDGRNDQGGRMGSGVYFYRFKTDHFDKARRMILIK